MIHGTEIPACRRDGLQRALGARLSISGKLFSRST